MYQKIADKDNKADVPAATSTKALPSETPPVKTSTPKINGTNGTPSASSGNKREEHLAPLPRKLPDFKREASSDVKRERASSKSPETNRESRPLEQRRRDAAEVLKEDGEVAE